MNYRYGATIYDTDSHPTKYSSINLAKKASHEIQKAGKGLGRGGLKLGKPTKKTRSV